MHQKTCGTRSTPWTIYESTENTVVFTLVGMFELTGLGELETVGDVHDLFILVEFKGGRTGVVEAFSLETERCVSLRRVYVEQCSCLPRHISHIRTTPMSETTREMPSTALRVASPA